MKSGNRPSSLDVPIHFVGTIVGTGGAAVMMLECADLLRQSGRDVQLFVPASLAGIPGFVERCNARNVPVSTRRTLDPGRRRLAATAAAELEVRRHGGRDRAAPLVHWHVTNNTLEHYWIRALKCARLRPGVASIHNPEYSYTRESQWMREWADAVPDPIARVLAISDRSRAQHISFGIDPAHVELVRNGVNFTTFVRGEAGPIRTEFNLDEDDQLIVVVARLEEIKRPLDAVAAFAALADHFPKARLALVGSGALEATVRQDVATRGLTERVIMAGFRTDVPNWLAAATVMLFSTESEANSLVIHEAMISGCAIVSTDCPGNDEMLDHGRNAFATPTGDPDAQAAALTTLLNDPELRARLAAGGRVTAESHSMQSVSEQLIGIYDEVLAQRA